MLILGVRIERSLAWRCLAGAIAAAIVSRAELHGLRATVTTAVIDVCHLASVHVQRIAQTTFSVDGERVQVLAHCTSLHVWFLVAPLLWRTGRSSCWNVAFQSALCVSILSLSIARIALSVVLYKAGLPWDPTHPLLCALTDFSIFLYVLGRAEPLQAARVAASATARLPAAFASARSDSRGGRGRAPAACGPRSET